MSVDMNTLTHDQRVQRAKDIADLADRLAVSMVEGCLHAHPESVVSRAALIATELWERRWVTSQDAEKDRW